MNGSKFLYLMTASIITIASGCSNDSQDEPQPEPEPETQPETEDYAQGSRCTVTVLDYSPAPGQFVNVIPEYEEGDTWEEINLKAAESLCNGDMITLGAWGGNVTLKLSEPIDNVEGNDFRVVGNAIYSAASTSGILCGSAEPGIVLVMKDENGNGLADDTWYELSGDQTANGIAGYSVTYYQPQADATDDQYIFWEASDGDCGYLNRVSSYHTQSFFPLWLGDVQTLTFEGRRLPDNGNYNTETSQFELTCYTGYADSHPNTTDYSCLDIDNAIDSDGNPVKLSSIDFIKIYTGVLQANGMLGECSTEVAAIERLDY